MWIWINGALLVFIAAGAAPQAAAADPPAAAVVAAAPQSATLARPQQSVQPASSDPASSPRQAAPTGVRVVRASHCYNPSNGRESGVLDPGDRLPGGAAKILRGGRQYWATWCGLVPIEDAVPTYN